MSLVNLSIYYTWKSIKSEYKNNKFNKYLLQLRMKLLIYLMDLILLLIFKITLNLSSKSMRTENPTIQIYANKIKSRIVFKIKTGYKLELLTSETMKLLGSTKKVVDKNKNSENVPKLESVEVVLVHCNLVKNDYQHASKVFFTFVPNKKFGQLLNIFPQVFTMMNTINKYRILLY